MQGWVDLVGLVTYQGGIPARRRSPIRVLTGLNVEQLRSYDERRYRSAKPPTNWLTRGQHWSGVESDIYDYLAAFEVDRRQVQSVRRRQGQRMVRRWWRQHRQFCSVAAADTWPGQLHGQLDEDHHAGKAQETQNEVIWSLPTQQSKRSSPKWFLARDVLYASRAYATTSVSVCLSVRLSATEVHCGHGACREEGRGHLALCQPLLGPLV